jgi:selenocysteine lyase/cysteine desulfurase
MSDMNQVSRDESVGRRNFIKKAVGGTALAALYLNELNTAVYGKLAELGQKYHPYDAPDGKYWDYVKEQFMLEPGLIMMNNGTAGTMPRVVFNTLVKFWKIQAQNAYKCYTRFRPYQEKVRTQIAEFIGATPDEIAILRNSTEGLNIIAQGLDLKPGDEVLLSNFEHPAGTGPLRLQEKRFGIKITEAKLNITPKSKDEILNAFNDAITPRTRMILISHAFYKTGVITPIKELAQLAHDKNVLIAVDGAHVIGMLDLDMHDLGVDYYANSAYKWLGAPTGCGIFYARKEAQDILWPNIASYDWDKAVGARKYSYLGRVAEPLIIALGEAIRFQNNIGKKRIERRIKTLATYLKENAAKIPGVNVLTPMDPELSGGINVLGPDYMKIDAFVNYLLEKHNLVIAPTYRDKNAARICTHIWISFKDIDILLNELNDLKGKVKRA